MRRRRTRSDKNVELFRAVVDNNTSLSMHNKGDKAYCIIRRDLTKDYDIDVMPSEAPILNKMLSDPEPYESSMVDIKVMDDAIFPINEAIKHVFGDEKDLNLHGIKLAIGGNKNDYVTIQEKDLIKYDVKPTLTG